MESSLTAGKNNTTASATDVASKTPRSSQIMDKNDFGSNPSLYKLSPPGPARLPVPMVLSQKTLGSTRLEERICMEDLQQLMRMFILADENGTRGLEIDEFKKSIGRILKGKKLSDHEMAVLHMKIDSDCDGSIDWDEFCTFMLLKYQEQDTMIFEKKPPFPFPIKKYTSPHRHCVYRITMLPSVSRNFETKTEGSGDNDGSIISISKDGIVCFWKKNVKNLKLYRTVNLTKLEKTTKARPLWVTDMVVMPNMHKVLLSFTDSVLAVYDLTTPTFERIFHITRMPHCVVAMDYWYDDKEFDHAILVLGDSGGGICIMEFTRATRCLFGYFGTSKGECQRIAFPTLLINKTENMRTMYLPEVHKDWISKIYYCHNLEGILSCSCDSNTALVFNTLQGYKESVFHVRKGVNSFGYSTDYNLIATGGMDQRIRLWNPYTVTKPSYEMRGHNSTIIFIAINDETGHLISFSKDLEARVWGVHNQRCLQVCHQFQEFDNIPSALYYYSPTSTLIAGYLDVGMLEGFREDLKTVAVVSHEYPLCGALYNSIFNQVVSGCNGSVVSVWDIETGQKAIQFSHCHGEVEITAMSFDASGRRLITGARDGSIKIWNFNNGACLKVLESSYNAEVICFALFYNNVLASGWSQVIAEYRDLSSKDPNDLIPTYWGKNIHEDDILSMAYHDPGIIATSSFDGDIILWDIMTEQVIAILNATDVDFSAQYTRLYNKTSKKPVEGNMVKEIRQSKKASVSNQRQNNLKNIGESKKPRFGYGTNNAVEKIIFLEKREKSVKTATLVACGAGGLVQFWNIYGGGMIGEFNTFYHIYKTEEEREAVHALHSVTTCKALSDNSILITGSSLGYVQVWDISSFCVDVPNESKPIKNMPPIISSWRGHTDAIISIDIVEHKELIITASLDCCVSLWTLCGRYIGTFGESYVWNLNNIEMRVPTRLQQIASDTTLQTIAPKIIKTFSLLYMTMADEAIEKELHVSEEKAKTNNEKNESVPIEDILKACKNPKKKPCPPIKLKVRNSEYGLSVYSHLKCPELQPEPTYSHPLSGPNNSKRNKKSEKANSCDKALPKKLITEKTLFPNTAESIK